MLERKRNHITKTVECDVSIRLRAILTNHPFCNNDLDATNSISWLPMSLIENVSVKDRKQEWLALTSACLFFYHFWPCTTIIERVLTGRSCQFHISRGYGQSHTPEEFHQYKYVLQT